MESKRICGIELFRLLCTFFICVLHVMLQGGVLFNSHGINNAIYWLIETFAYCAVNGYGLISGYIFNSDRYSYKRIVFLWFQVFFYSFVFTLILRFFEVGNSLSLWQVIQCAMPIIFKKFWYMSSYFPLFFFMPYINKLINSLNNKQAKNILIILVTFATFGLIKDIFLAQGYSFLWLAILFTIGLIIKKLHIFEKTKTSILLLIYVVCVILSWLPKVILNIEWFINYISPTILLSAMVLLIAFSRINIDYKSIRFVSSFTTGIYLFQNNQIIWNYIIKDRFLFIANMNLVQGILLIFLCGLMIFAIGLVTDVIRKGLFDYFEIDFFASETGRLINNVFGKLKEKFIKQKDY